MTLSRKASNVGSVITSYYNLAESMPTVIDEECCDGCGTCVEVCPYGVYERLDEKPAVAQIMYCKECGTCVEECPNCCISFRKKRK